MGRRPTNRGVVMPPEVPEVSPESDADRATAEFRARGSSAARSNGPSDQVILKHIRLVDMAREADMTGHAKFMTACKAAEEDGVDVKVLKRTATLKRRMNASQVIAELQKELHYLMLRNMPVTQAELFPPDESGHVKSVLTETIDEAREWDAEDQGFHAGKAGRSKGDHGYPAGSRQAASWRRGWNRFHLGEGVVGPTDEDDPVAEAEEVEGEFDEELAG